MPPPRKILRRGTPELEDALLKGEVLLSLPTTTSSNAPISQDEEGHDGDNDDDIKTHKSSKRLTKEMIILQSLVILLVTVP